MLFRSRQQILQGINCRTLIMEMVDKQVDEQLEQFLHRDFGASTFAGWASQQLAAQLDASDFRGMDFQQADSYARDAAERVAETQVQDAIDENLPDSDDGDTSEWNWNALANLAQSRWNYKINDRELKKAGREAVPELLLDAARKSIQSVDLSAGQAFLTEDFGLQSTAQWLAFKFGMEVKVEELRGRDTTSIKEFAREKAEQVYRNREAEYPILAAVNRFTTRDGSRRAMLDGEALLQWAQTRFGSLVPENIREHRSVEEVRQTLIAVSTASQNQERELEQAAGEHLKTIFGNAVGNNTASQSARGADLDSFSDWLEENLQADMTSDEIGKCKQSELESRLAFLLNRKFHPEIRHMERQVLLQVVDSAWKEHLLVMDHLRSSVGLVGYAQVDPKVEYKREGMRLFDQMWNSVGERCTDLVFKVEQLDSDFIGSTWVETSARHDQAATPSQMAREQQGAVDASQGEPKVETIRHRGERVGRNDPCPCGSGRKYKQCCMRRTAAN